MITALGSVSVRDRDRANLESQSGRGGFSVAVSLAATADRRMYVSGSNVRMSGRTFGIFRGWREFTLHQGRYLETTPMEGL